MTAHNVEHCCSGQTLTDRITFWGQTEPDTAAFIFWNSSGRRVLSRGEILDLSSKFAYKLTKHGIKPGDVVCINLPNSPERVVVEFGIQLAGAVSMNGQALRADGEDLLGSLYKANCVCIILNPSQKNNAWQVCKEKLDNCNIHIDHAKVQIKSVPSLVTVVFCNIGFYNELHSKEMFIYEGASPEETATIFTTSGTTGYSKLVPRNSKALLTTAFFADQSMKLKPGTNCLNCSPLGWTGGYPLLYLFSGCTRVAVDESQGEITDRTAILWDIISQGKIDVALMPQSMLTELCDRKRSLQSELKLPQIFTRGQPVKRAGLNVLLELSDTISIAYGSTELGLVSEFIYEAKNSELFEDFIVGRPFVGIGVKIVDDEFHTVPYQTSGEILIKSPTLCTGYIGEAQDSFLRDGWFRTGDIGVLREDGCLLVEGRRSDAIMHGTYILYPTWLEQKLINCPGVKEVVIVPVPDEVLHHEICACVKLDDTTDVHPTAEDIINFCIQETVLDRSSSLNVIPKYVIFLKEFPLTKTNKLDRRGLAESAREQLQL